jgi:hypothetical protein
MKALSQTAVVTCDHGTGIVANAASQQLVTVFGVPLLIGKDPVGKGIAGCTNVSTTIKPCTSTINLDSGNSSWVTINGQGVCLDSVVGGTDGTPPSATKYRVKFAGQVLVDIDG